jgi:hypothetical protein
MGTRSAVPSSPRPAARFVAGAIVGHDALHDDPEAGVVSDGGLQEGYGAFLLLVGQHLRDCDARSIVDADVDELPADAATIALACERGPYCCCCMADSIAAIACCKACIA